MKTLNLNELVTQKSVTLSAMLAELAGQPAADPAQTFSNPHFVARGAIKPPQQQ